MLIQSREELIQNAERWNGKQHLVERVTSILKGNGATNAPDEIVRRIRTANNILVLEGFKILDCEVKINVWRKLSPVYSEREMPSLDLMGISFPPGTDLRGMVLTGAHLEGARFHKVNLEDAHFDSTALERAILNESSFRNACFIEAKMHGATFNSVDLYGADFTYSKLEGAVLHNSNLIMANFHNAHFGPLSLFEIDQHEDPANKILLTTFKNSRYLPIWKDHFLITTYRYNLEPERIKSGKVLKRNYSIKLDFDSFRRHLLNGWFYTNFSGVRIDDADTVMAPDLYRYVKDQQYLLQFKATHPWIYRIWKVLSDCGGKLSVVGFWSALIVLLFSKLYPWTNSIDPSTIGTLKSNLPDGWLWLFISFDIFSNLGIRNTTPLHPFGVVLMIAESVLGLMMLGMLISVLQNRFARRS